MDIFHRHLETNHFQIIQNCVLLKDRSVKVGQMYRVFSF